MNVLLLEDDSNPYVLKESYKVQTVQGIVREQRDGLGGKLFYHVYLS